MSSLFDPVNDDPPEEPWFDSIARDYHGYGAEPEIPAEWQWDSPDE